MAEYINRVDAINALTSDEADESMTVYLDGVYGRLMAIKREPVFELRDIVDAIAGMLLEHPEHGDTLSKFLIALLDGQARKETGYHD